MGFEYRKHPCPVVAELEGARPRHPVVVVGAGPVGLTLALALVGRGIPVVVLEERDSVGYGSRAICISRRSLEILHRLGVARPFLEKGLPWTGGRSFFRDKQVLAFAMPSEPGEQHPPMVNLQQYYAEQYLVDALERRQGAEIRWQSKVVSLRHDADAVTLGVESALGAYGLEAEWVVACDGARSFVRQALGLSFEGSSYEGRYVIVDIHLPSSHPTERRAWFDPPTFPGTTVLMHRQPDDIWRIDYQLRPDDDPEEEVRLERVVPKVAAHLEWIGETAPWEVQWNSLYKAHSLSLPSYRHGRILFAGDAAHLLPIFGVRGLNSGVADAYNLAWKLAWVLEGRARLELLDTYSDEQRHAAAENMRQAHLSTVFMTPPSAGFHLARDAALSLAVSVPEFQCLLNPRQTTPIGYPRSELNTETDEEATFSRGPHPGDPVPNVPLIRRDPTGAEVGSFLLDELAPDFTLLCFGDCDAALVSGSVAATVLRIGPRSARGPFLADAAGRFTDRFDGRDGCAYLVRPDGHVAARWRTISRDAVSAAITRACRTAAVAPVERPSR